MKRFLMVMLVLFVTLPAVGKLTPNQAWKKSLGGNFGLTFAGTSVQRDAVPSGVWTKRDGDFWYDTTGNQWYTYDSSAWNAFSAGGGTTLTGAYNYGGAGVGRTITATDGAVQITNTDNDTASLLGLTYSGNTTGDGLTITMSVGSGDAIEIENTGTGSDIEGTGALWTISKAGFGVFKGGLTLNTGGELLVTARDVLFDDTYDVAWDTSRDQFIFQDNAVLGLGGAHDAAADITLSYDGTDLLMEAAVADDKWKIGATTNFDIQIYGDTATDYVLFDTSAEDMSLNGFDLTLEDGDFLKFGDGDDWTIDSSTATILDIVPATTDETSSIRIGADTSGGDLRMYGATTATYAEWDASEDELLLLLADLKISQGSQIEFIDVTDGLTDWTIDNATDETLLIYPTETTDDQTVNFGGDTVGVDIKVFGATTGEYWLFDASADSVLPVLGNYLFTANDAEADQFKVDVTGTVAGNAINLETTDGGVLVNADGAANGDIELNAADDLSLTAAGLVNLNGSLVNAAIQDIPAGGTTTAVTLTNIVITVGSDVGGDIVTIANGTPGQILYLICNDATGTTTITPATFNGGTSITFNALGDTITLIYTTGTGWSIVGGNSYTII